MSIDNDLKVAEDIGLINGKMDRILEHIEKQCEIPERVAKLEAKQKVMWGLTGAPITIAVVAFIKSFFIGGIDR